ncbi:MAG: hypothetical protein FJ028_00110 [Chloroflexi bacterium]|nr:hypothetical protein [Chloroflexota bacterium]
MFTKLLSLLIAGQGGGLAAATIVSGATTVSVMTTSPELQDTLAQITSPGKAEERKPADAGKPADRPGGRPSAVPGRP